MIPDYPDSSELTLEMRNVLHPRFQRLPEGISEYTFSNLYLFRKAHQYRISRLLNNLLLIFGRDRETVFFMLPFGLPEKNFLDRLFDKFREMKCVSASQAAELSTMGYTVMEDRDNFDYLYLRRDLAELAGRNYHKKRNLIKAFINQNTYEGRPLLEENKPDAHSILDAWQQKREEPGDHAAAKEALEKTEILQLCGGIFYVKDQPVAYSLGEELAGGRSFAIHFEKAVSKYKGLYQFVNQAFAAILPDHYLTINREQDLGNEGLRKAKESYKPVDFVKKYRVVSR